MSQKMQEILFERIEGETSQELEKRFEVFYRTRHYYNNFWDEDRCSVQSVVFKRNSGVGREVRIRVYVGAVEGKFANGAYKSAERSGG
ncbi:14775_t:CDS:2, partial [Dentiscutata erythropus]